MLAIGMLVALPTFSSGATVKNDLRSFQAPSPRVTSATPRTQPPLHATNPHGQGTAAVIDVTPSAERPFSVDADGNADDEDIIVGRSRGEQRADGTYHGHITVASAFGNEIIGRDTLPGQKIGEANNLESIGDPSLDMLCTNTGICLGLAEVYSETTSTGSFNSFRLARAALGGTNGLPGLRIAAAESTGNISSDGTCQTSNGGSRVADVQAGAAVAEVAQSTSQSRACTNAAPTQANTSSVIGLGGQVGVLPVPIPVGAGCVSGGADTETGLPLLLPIVCNADDSSATGGTQSPALANRTQAYGVRNALDVYVLATGATALAQISAAQSESLAVSPAAATTTTPATTTATTPVATTAPAPATTPTDPGATDDGGTAGEDDAGGESGNAPADDDAPECSDGVDNDGDGKIDFGSDPGCSSAEDDSEADAVSLGGKELPFTGTDVIVLGLAGSILLAAGLTLRGPARRRELD